MKKKILYFLFFIVFVLSGCTSDDVADKDCVHSYCLESNDYNLIGNILVESIDNDLVTLKTTMEATSEANISDMDIVIVKENNGDDIHFVDSDINYYNDSIVEYRFLDPSTIYYAILIAEVVGDYEIEEVVLDYIEFETGSYEQISPTAELMNIRIRDDLIVFDLNVDMNNYELYWGFAYIFDGPNTDVNRYYKEERFLIGDDHTVEYQINNTVFDDLEANTTYWVSICINYYTQDNVMRAYYSEPFEFTIE